jgi:hypothetical protein
VSGRIVTVLLYAGPILAGMTLGVIFREPVLVLLGIVVTVSVAISWRIAASRAKTRIKGGRFEGGRWIDLPEPRRPYMGGLDSALVGLTVEVAEELAPKVKQALEERARERKP